MKYLTATLGLVSIALAILYQATTVHSHVRSMDQKAQKDLFDYLIAKSDKTSLRKPQLKTYKYINCGVPSRDIANLTSLVFGPDPIVFPGVLYVQFAVTIHTLLDAPIKAVVLMEKKVGDSWLKIPCIGYIGSCEYDDLCQLLAQIGECPEPFVDAGVPCQCPFQQGQYALPQTEFDVEIPIFPAGDYHFRANLTNNDNSVGCAEIFATFA
ncbi:ganglioside GM2 activator-like [Biomphalaria glabrata]|uniref:Ganglioside GM2 activator-like n=2 Tax=Biomphalaria glabrata TaxID=6526 RepID=A0A9U8E404_BIOGL|nr:ganglioside GM2 activator-like [Biomphalaria glabrata]